MIANVIQNPQVDFKNFINLVNTTRAESGKALIKLQQEHELVMKPTEDDWIGHVFRSSGEEFTNNRIRDVFLKSVLDKFHASDASQLPKDIKDAMCLKDFRGVFGWECRMTGEMGSTITGKPLSLRRIRAVVQAVQRHDIEVSLRNIAFGQKLPELIEDGKAFLNDYCQYQLSQPKVKIDENDAEAAHQGIDSVVEKLQTRLQKFDWKNMTVTSYSKFTDLLEVIGKQLNPKQQMSDLILDVTMTVALRTYMKSNPDFANFVKRHEPMFQQMEKGAETTFSRLARHQLTAARVLNDTMNLADELTRLPDKDCLARLKKLDGNSFYNLTEQMNNYPIGSLAAAKPKVMQFINGWLRPKLVQQPIEKAVDWLVKTYPGTKGNKFYGAGFVVQGLISLQGVELNEDEEFKNKIDQVAHQIQRQMTAIKNASDKSKNVSKVNGPEKKEEVSDADRIATSHGHELRSTEYDDLGHEFRHVVLKPGEYEIERSIDPPSVAYRCSETGVDCEKDEFGIVTRVNSGKLVHEIKLNDPSRPVDQACEEIWHVNEQGE